MQLPTGLLVYLVIEIATLSFGSWLMFGKSAPTPRLSRAFVVVLVLVGVFGLPVLIYWYQQHRTDRPALAARSTP